MSETTKVVVRFTVDLEMDYPAEYASKEQIEFRFNEGTWCADNLVDELREEMERRNELGQCLCSIVSAEVLETDIQRALSGEVG